MSKARLITVLAMVALVGSLLTIGSQATATHSLPHLNRQINKLEKDVNDLQRDNRQLTQAVRVLLEDVFVCTFPGDPLVSFSDGSQGYSLYYDPACTTTAGSSVAGVGDEPTKVKREVTP